MKDDTYYTYYSLNSIHSILYWYEMSTMRRWKKRVKMTGLILNQLLPTDSIMMGRQVSRSGWKLSWMTIPWWLLVYLIVCIVEQRLYLCALWDISSFQNLACWTTVSFKRTELATCYLKFENFCHQNFQILIELNTTLHVVFTLTFWWNPLFAHTAPHDSCSTEHRTRAGFLLLQSQATCFITVWLHKRSSAPMEVNNSKVLQRVNTLSDIMF